MANEKRLIDANAVESKILDCINAFHENMIESGAFGNWKGCTLDGLQKASQIIFTTPTVDAVEVVRCKDCEHRYVATSGVIFCTQHLTMSANDDDFCSCGERKGDGNG